MEDSWELVTVPSEIQRSTVGKQSPSDGSETSLEKNEENSKSKKVSSASPKLCGFLNKLGAKGIKTWKTRWFVYDERKCRLYYYRTPQDFTPLGLIDLAKASFSFEVEDASRLTQFQICTSGRTYQLQAKDKQTMMFWLQELQARRREFSRKRANNVVQNKGDIAALGQSTCGLLAEEEETTDEKNVGSLEDYVLLEKLNKMTVTKYGEMSNTAKTLITAMEELDKKYKSLEPYLEQIDKVEESVASLEQAAYRLDAYSKRLEAKFKKLERR